MKIKFEIYVKDREKAEDMITPEQSRLSQIRLDVKKNEIAEEIIKNVLRFSANFSDYDDERIWKARKDYGKDFEWTKKEAYLVESLFGDKMVLFKAQIAEVLVAAELCARDWNRNGNYLGGYIFSFFEGQALNDQDYLDIRDLVAKKAIEYLRSLQC